MWWHSGDLHMASRFSIFSKKQRQKQGIDFSVILNSQLFSRRVILQLLCQKEETHNTLFWLSIVGSIYVYVVGNVSVVLEECISCWKYVDITLCRFCTAECAGKCYVRRKDPQDTRGWIPFPRVMELCCGASDSAEPNQNI